MNSRAASSFLSSQQNLANQRASWWGGQQAAQMSNIAGRNAAESTHTQSTNAASLAGPTTNGWAAIGG